MYRQVTGDDSPDTLTVVETVQELYCRDPQCSLYGCKAAENRVLLYRSDTDETKEES